MPTTVDPAVWLAELLDTRWSTGIESLRASGVEIGGAHKPNFKPIGSRGATESVKNSVSAKFYATTDEVYSRVTHGVLDEDGTVSWAVKFDAQGEYERCRRAARECALIAHRILVLYRRDPHPEWHEIDNLRIVQGADYPDYQSRTVQFTLKRFGEVLPANIDQVTS